MLEAVNEHPRLRDRKYSRCDKRSAKSGERAIAYGGRAMKQANVVHRITTAGLVIDAAIIPHDEIAQGPFMTIHVVRRRLIRKQRVEQRLRLSVVHVLYADGETR